MAEEPSSPTFPATFMRTVVEDVIAARQLLSDADGDAARRNLVRTTFSAIEGLLWMTREHVLAVATGMGTLTPLAGLALREQTYAVDNRGRVIEQTRSVTLQTAVRLLASQAGLIDANLRVRFDAAGWEALGAGVAVRNRVTHPRTLADLAVSNDDLQVIEQGFLWLLATTEYIMASTNLAFKTHIARHRQGARRPGTGRPGHHRRLSCRARRRGSGRTMTPPDHSMPSACI